MKVEFGRGFWIVLTAAIMIFTLFIVGRNAIHAFKIKREIKHLTQEQESYQTLIEQDSTLLEQLKYDNYLEEYAREHYHMQRLGERIYIIEE